MDEENKQVTADEVYSYGESTEESAGEPEEKEEPEPEATGSEDSQDNKFVYQDNQYDYSQQYSQNRNEQSDNSPMDLKDWILTLIVLLIPCVGIVMYFVWAFESNGNINRRNFCRAQLIIFAVLLGIYLVLFILFSSSRDWQRMLINEMPGSVTRWRPLQYTSLPKSHENPLIGS
ncbi:MAG: hypothetical protein Q3X47_05560 [Dorea sp.]|uniref:hypothetical protein n=1 Tax=Dorea sp. TaxID=2040332 RepID=UPI002849DF3B|nr:hypothetical protein [Dorea sp.]MDR3925779.1 hypothetical protein [Dorea sp.]